MYGRFAVTIRRIVVGFIFLALACSNQYVEAQQLFERVRADLRELGKTIAVKKRPVTGQDNHIELLAREIDWLEGHVASMKSSLLMSWVLLRYAPMPTSRDLTRHRSLARPDLRMCHRQVLLQRQRPQEQCLQRVRPAAQLLRQLI